MWFQSSGDTDTPKNQVLHYKGYYGAVKDIIEGSSLGWWVQSRLPWGNYL